MATKISRVSSEAIADEKRERAMGFKSVVTHALGARTIAVSARGRP